MYAAIHPRTSALATGRPGTESPMHTAVLATAAVILGSFLLGALLLASLMLTGPLPVNDGAAPLPQMLPQPSAAAALDR